MALSKAEVPRTCFENELRMVLVGKTGAGKSETGNTIAGKEIFYSDEAATSVTKTSRQFMFAREGQNLQLIDVPGFVDTNLSEEEIKAEVMKCVAISHPGLHAILFVISIGRFTDDAIKTIEQFCKCFGEESMEFVIVIFTKMDSLKRKKKSLEEYIKAAPTLLTDFLAKTKNRYLGVNNWSDDDAEKELFIRELLDMVKRLVHANGERYYTNEMYQKAEQKLLENIEKEMKRLAEEERERDAEKLRQAREEFQKELEKQNLKKEDLMRQVKVRDEKFRREFENDRRDRAIRQQRERVAALTGRAVGGAGGTVISYIGSEAFEYVGSCVGYALAGPMGKKVGHFIGGVLGQAGTTSSLSYVGGKIGKKLV